MNEDPTFMKPSEQNPEAAPKIPNTAVDIMIAFEELDEAYLTRFESGF
jgi:hypothetical protein